MPVALRPPLPEAQNLRLNAAQAHPGGWHTAGTEPLQRVFGNSAGRFDRPALRRRPPPGASQSEGRR